MGWICDPFIYVHIICILTQLDWVVGGGWVGMYTFDLGAGQLCEYEMESSDVTWYDDIVWWQTTGSAFERFYIHTSSL